MRLHQRLALVATFVVVFGVVASGAHDVVVRSTHAKAVAFNGVDIAAAVAAPATVPARASQIDRAGAAVAGSVLLFLLVALWCSEPESRRRVLSTVGLSTRRRAPPLASR